MTARPTVTNMTAIEVTQAISENEQSTIEATASQSLTTPGSIWTSQNGK